MEENTFPPVLKSLINSINAEGHLQSWQLNTTLDTYSLTLEWDRKAFCNNDDHKPSESVESWLENSTQTPGQTTALLNEDHNTDVSKEVKMQWINVKTLKRCDSQTRCVQNPSTVDNNYIEDDTELNVLNESDIPEAAMNENEVEYETQISIQGRRKPNPLIETQLCERNFNLKTRFNSSPGKYNGSHTASDSGQLTNDNRVKETRSMHFSKQDDDKKKAICSCGEAFSSRSLSISHLLSTCPVSLCFRVELEYNVQQVIDSWHGDEKVIGKAWWQSYKTNGFRDIGIELKDEKTEQLQALVNQFIDKTITQTLRDKKGNSFVLMAGLNDLED